MTADPARRRRSAVRGGVAGLAAVIAVIAVAAVAFSTLRTSEEGRAPEVDDRTVLTFPSTPNAALGIVDDLDRLTSVAVFTLDPSGAGGSIVTVPVNGDETNGNGPERLPVSRESYPPGDAGQTEALAFRLESLLSISLDHVEVVGADELADLLAVVGPVDADLPEDVVDSDAADSDVLVDVGEQRLDTDTLVAALTAIDATGSSYEHHDVDVALWSAIGDAAGDADADVPLDGDERPVPAGDLDELWLRLLSGEVAVRDVAINVVATRDVENPTDADAIQVDRRDALLVFGSVSPNQVSRPNESLNLALVIGFAEADVARLGNGADGEPTTKASDARRFIGELLFAAANVVSVDLADVPGDVPEVTRIEITNPEFEDEVRKMSEPYFGDAEVVVSQTVIEDVDAVVVLGQDFLLRRADMLEMEREQADETGDEPTATDTVPDDE